jgi:SAM-dependent methyltransferase
MLTDLGPTLADAAASLLAERDGIYAADLLVAAVSGLDFFTWLSGHPSDVEGICAEFGLDPRAADVMCTLFRSMGLVSADRGQLTTTEAAQAFLVAASQHDMRAYFSSLAERPQCAELLQVLRTGEPAAWGSAGSGKEWVASMDDPGFAERITAAMDARGSYLAPQLAKVLADLGATRALDIAGGSGIYACALVDAVPGLRATVLERPPVDLAAGTLIEKRGYSDRVDVLAGDMFADPLPDGYDLHLLSHTLHDWDEATVGRLLAACASAIAPGGWIVDFDTHINADKSGPLSAARYSVLLMHSTRGKCWSVAELGELLRNAGFGPAEERPVTAGRTALIARRQ